MSGSRSHEFISKFCNFLSYSVVPALGFLSGAVGPILTAIASKTVEADEQGMCL